MDKESFDELGGVEEGGKGDDHETTEREGEEGEVGRRRKPKQKRGNNSLRSASITG